MKKKCCVESLVVALVAVAGGLPPTILAQAQPLEPKLVIEGRMQQAGTNVPLQGDVTLIEGTAPRLVTNYSTDPRGYFRIEARAATRKTLVAKAPGHVSAVRVLPPSASGPVEVYFHLFPAVAVSGILLDATGSPIEGATVRVSYPGEAPAFILDTEVGSMPTDAFGRFELRYVRAGARFVLEVTKPGYLPAFSNELATGAVAIEGLRVQVRLQKGATVEGVVQDPTGRPISGAVLDLRLMRPTAMVPFNPSSLAGLELLGRRAVSSLNGTFRFDGLPPAAFVIVARHPDYGPAKIELPVLSQEKPTSVAIVLGR
jgi:hypothetical protein